MTYYVMDADGAVRGPMSLVEWAHWYETSWPARIVAKTQVGDVEVSTVFLGLDHSHIPGGPPVLFESMLFGGDHDGWCDRYHTRAPRLRLVTPGSSLRLSRDTTPMRWRHDLRPPTRHRPGAAVARRRLGADLRSPGVGRPLRLRPARR